jgi:hypothetical protein
MVSSPPAYVHASIGTEEHGFSGPFGLVLFMADSFVGSEIVPNVPLAV